MKNEKLIQLERHIRQEAIAGNFEPMEQHSGMTCVVDGRRYLYNRTSGQSVDFLLQFQGGDWLASIQKITETHTQPIYGMDNVGTTMSYEILTFNHFTGDEITQVHSQPDFMSIMAQSKTPIPGFPEVPLVDHTYTQIGDASLSPDSACVLIRQLIEAGIDGKYDLLEDHPAFRAMIPAIQNRDAISDHVDASFPVQFSDGEWVATRLCSTRIVKDRIFGIEAPGRQIEIEDLMVHRIENGRVVAQREFIDLESIMKQLGMMPSHA